ncbi:MAG: hypothetical protein R2882_04655 [Gemmatimonadales bacterium]
MLLLARIVHVGGGVFWAGALFFTAMFLGPAMRNAGPAGGQVGSQIANGPFPRLMPVIALLTLLSGFYLIRVASAGFGAGYMGSGPASHTASACSPPSWPS